MKVNDQINNTAYNMQYKNTNTTNKSAEEHSGIKESFNLSILKENSANTYNTQEANSVLKNIDFKTEVQSFSKENLSGFAQPLTQAQAHLSSQSVHQLLQ